MTNKIQTKLYLEEELRNRLVEQAKAEKRSINNMIEVMIEKYLDDCKKQGK